MAEFTVRVYRSEDVGALRPLWKGCFGDSDEFISGFFDALPALGGGVVAEVSGEIAGAAYGLCCQRLVDGEGRETPMGLIYGVGVKESFRGHGIGEALSRAACELCISLGAKIVCTEPAEESLAAWYCRILGFEKALFRELASYEAKSGPACRRLTAAEYSARREELLRGRAHVALSEAGMEFQEFLLRVYGGGFMAVGNGLAAVSAEGGKALIRELLCSAEDKPVYAAAAAAALGAERAELLSPAESGGSYILSGAPLPGNCLWNLSFD